MSFLQDVRDYRTERLAEVGMTPHFPLWGRDARALAAEMIGGGLRAFVTCLDPRKMPPSFAGAAYDMEFLRALSENVDPCAENGEFHTFVYDGPIFREPVQFQKGEVILRDNRFWYCDLE